MELGAGSRDPSLSEKVWRKDFIWWLVGGGCLGVQHTVEIALTYIVVFFKAKVETVRVEI